MVTANGDSSERIAFALVELCAKCGLTVGCAESCTAGLVASSIADVPGASQVLQGGVVSYTEAVKQSMLGVSLETLETVGAVSEKCACEMAAGAREALGCDIAVSVTGFAGPGGGTADNPVGTVYIGISTKNLLFAKRFLFSGERAAVRHAACEAALRALLDAAQEL